MKIERKLAAIMFTDIVGYTSQMSKDQDVALSLLDIKRKTLKPLIQKYKGTLVKEMGDGTLSHFPSAVDATNCSLDLQKSLKDNNDLNIRIGVHLGDTSFRDNDVFGDGVNIASRLEKMSPPGGILVSKNVYDELSSRKGYDGISLGLQSMKGVGRLVEVFGLKDEYLNVPKPSNYIDTKIKIHKDKEVPSIAIIPFDNKGSEEDEFYAYGICADLISDCSSAGLIRVASLKEVEELEDIPFKEKAKKLDVRYVATGSLWKMKEIFQLSVELYDTKSKQVMWSDRWQENWDNLPTIKMNLSDGLLKALDTTSKVEKRKETTNPEAYEFYLKAKHRYDKRENTDDTEIAQGLLHKVIELDDNLITAKVLLGFTYFEMGNYDKAMEIYTPALKQSKEVGDKDGMGYSLNCIGIVHADKGDYNKALDYYTRSLAIKEEIGDKSGMGGSLNNIGLVHRDKGDYDNALDYHARSLAIFEELGNMSGMGACLGNIGIVHADKGDYNKALDYYAKSLAISEELGNKRGMGHNLNSIGIVHTDKGDYNKALDYHARSLAISEELGNKREMGHSLSDIGNVHYNKGDLDKALDYHARSLVIKEEVGDKRSMGYSLNCIGIVHTDKGDYNKALDYHARSLAIKEEIGDKSNMGGSLTNIGYVHYNKGDYNKALDYYARSLAIFDELSNMRGMGACLGNIGFVHVDKGDYEKAQEYLEKSLSIKKEIGLGTDDLIWPTTFLYLTYKHLGKDYDEKEIHALIKEAENIEKAHIIEFGLNLQLYELLGDRLYLETAYNQVQGNASAMEDDVKAKFLSYPIPKAIVKKYNKVFK